MTTSELLRAVAYVDGGCVPNPGRGGWGAVVVTGEETHELMGGEENSTNQRAEIMAAITALEELERPAEAEIVSDSMYLTNCGSGQWKRRTNRDLWARLDAAAALHRVSYRWIRGHAGNPGNERAHELAMRAIEGGASRTPPSSARPSSTTAPRSGLFESTPLTCPEPLASSAGGASRPC